MLGDPAELRPRRKAAFMRKEPGERFNRMLEHPEVSRALDSMHMAAHLRRSLHEAHEY